jgi:2-C-methyl-D-erythritol 4-phosphate cytidylyltransferase
MVAVPDAHKGPGRGTANGSITGAGRGEAWAVVLAAGGGTRFGGRKQFADLGGEPMLAHPARVAATVCDGVVVVLPEADVLGGPGRQRRRDHGVTVPPEAQVLGGNSNGWDGGWRFLPDGVRVVAGGASRAQSVRAGLDAVPRHAEIIVITDAAHPLATTTLYRQVVETVRDGADAAVPGLPLTEVVKEVVPAGSGLRAGASLLREAHRIIQTPHAFRAELLRAAHAGASEAVEDSAMVADAGGTVSVVPGEPANIHVTTPAELDMARLLLPHVLGLAAASQS